MEDGEEIHEKMKAVEESVCFEFRASLWRSEQGETPSLGIGTIVR